MWNVVQQWFTQVRKPVRSIRVSTRYPRQRLEVEGLEQRLVMDASYLYTWAYMDPISTTVSPHLQAEISDAVTEFGNTVATAQEEHDTAITAALTAVQSAEATAYDNYVASEAAAKDTSGSSIDAAVSTWDSSSQAAASAFQSAADSAIESRVAYMASAVATYQSAASSAQETFDATLASADASLAAAQAAYDADPSDPDSAAALTEAQAAWNAAAEAATPAFIEAMAAADTAYNSAAAGATSGLTDALSAFDAAISAAAADFDTAKMAAVSAYSASEGAAWATYQSAKSDALATFVSATNLADSILVTAEESAKVLGEAEVAADEAEWATAESGYWSNYLASCADEGVDPADGGSELGMPDPGTNFAADPPPPTPPSLSGRQRNYLPALPYGPSAFVALSVSNPNIVGTPVEISKRGAMTNAQTIIANANLVALGAQGAERAGFPQMSGEAALVPPAGYHTAGPNIKETIKNITIPVPYPVNDINSGDIVGIVIFQVNLDLKIRIELGITLPD